MKIGKKQRKILEFLREHEGKTDLYKLTDYLYKGADPRRRVLLSRADDDLKPLVSAGYIDKRSANSFSEKRGYNTAISLTKSGEYELVRLNERGLIYRLKKNLEKIIGGVFVLAGLILLVSLTTTLTGAFILTDQIQKPSFLLPIALIIAGFIFLFKPKR